MLDAVARALLLRSKRGVSAGMATWKKTRNLSAIVTTALIGVACGGGGGSGLGPTSQGGQAQPVAVTIVNPGAPVIETSDQSMSLQGTASSNTGVANVVWKSNRGTSGQASGTQAWQTAKIVLELGANRITVTASDHSGNKATDTIVIHRESEHGKSVTLSWIPPTQRADGSPLTDLAGYKIHYGRMSRTYDYEIRIDNPGIASYVVEGLNPGYWYFSLTAFDRDGDESKLSNEARTKVE